MSKPTITNLSGALILGQENLPDDSGFLLIPSLLKHSDLLVVERLLEGRELHYLVDEDAVLAEATRAYIERDGARTLVIGAATATEAFASAIQSVIGGGGVVIYLPSEAASISAPLTVIPGLKLDFLLKAGVPVVPTYVFHPRDTAMPIERTPSDEEVRVGIEPPLTGAACTLPAYQEALFRLAEQTFAQSPSLDRSLGYALIQGLKKFGPINSIIDGKDGSALPFGKVFAAALALSRYIRQETQKKRVGIVLPPSPICLIANVAVVLAGKVPVNLNFTAGRASIESAIRQADIDRFLTADQFVRKMQAFPWPPLKNLVMLERLMPSLKGKATLWFILSKILPAPLLASVLGVSKKGGHTEATLLFTSGSSGEPKGVVLTHRNLMSNVSQFGSRLNMGHDDSILACLPQFHSFGCTVTLWYPLIYGLNLASYPSPLETKELAGIIQKHRVSVLIATPTFLRGYMRGVNREQLAPLKLVVTGAEKLPRSVAEAFETKFGKKVLEGYGLTETSPVSNVNLPDPQAEDEGAQAIALAHRPGSVGQTMPGMAIRLTNPDTGAPVPLHESGIIWFKGGNVFTGYLNDPKRSAEVLDAEGWFRTGDVGRVDLDGFLYIEGRISRFSKIAGEMVPHETVEEAMNRALGLEGESTRRLTIVGIPDPERGEALVLLTTLPGGPENTEIVALRHRLLEHGVPALWIPKRMVRIADIPVLASGKLDIKACEAIAKAAVG